MRAKKRVLPPKSLMRAERDRVPLNLQPGITGAMIMQRSCRSEDGKYAFPFPKRYKARNVVDKLALFCPVLCDMIAVEYAKDLAEEVPSISVRTLCFQTALNISCCFPQYLREEVISRYEGLAFQIAMFHALEIPYGWSGGYAVLQMSVFPAQRHHPTFQWRTNHCIFEAQGVVYASILQHLLDDLNLKDAKAFAFTCRWTLMLLRTLIGNTFVCCAQPRWDRWLGHMFGNRSPLLLKEGTSKHILHFWCSTCSQGHIRARTVEKPRDVVQSCQDEHYRNESRFSDNKENEY